MEQDREQEIHWHFHLDQAAAVDWGHLCGADAGIPRAKTASVEEEILVFDSLVYLHLC